MKHECSQEKLLDVMLKKIDKIDSKLDAILQWKWQICGVVTAIGVGITIISRIIL